MSIHKCLIAGAKPSVHFLLESLLFFSGTIILLCSRGMWE